MTEHELRELSYQFDRLTRALKGNTDAASEIKKTEYQTAKKIVDIKLGGVRVTKQSFKSLYDLGDVMLSNSNDLGRYGKVVNTLAKNLGQVAGQHGRQGIVIGASIKVLGSFVSAITDQFKATLAAHDVLAKHGATLQINSNQLLQSANASMFTSKTLEQLANTVGKLGPNLLSIDSTTSGATYKFIQLANVGREVTNEFSNVGIEQQKLAELQANYLGQQTFLGLPLEKNVDTERIASLAYVDNILMLTQLTGNSKQELVEKLAAQKRDVAFSLKLAQYQQNGDIATVTRLQNAEVLMQSFGDDYAAGVRDIITNFTATTEEGKTLLGLTNGQIVGWSHLLTDGKISEEEYARRVALAFEAKKQLYGSSVGVGFMGDTVARSLGITSRAQEASIAALSGRTTVEARQRLSESKKHGDSLNASRNAQLNAERTLGTAMDKLLASAGKPAASAFQMLADLTVGTIRIVAKTVQMFGGELFDGVDRFLYTVPEIKEQIADITDSILKSNVGIQKQEKIVEKFSQFLLDDPLNYELNAELSNEQDKLETLRSKRAKLEKTREQKEKTLAELSAQQNDPAKLEQVSQTRTSSVKKLLDYIGGLESGGNYNVVNGGSRYNLTEMTVGEVISLQDKIVANGGQSAAGKYQIKKSTLQGLVNSGVVSYRQKFNESTQDILGESLLKRRGYDKFQQAHDYESFADSLAAEWAGLPTRSGKSYYQGVGNNKALDSRANFINVLKAKNGGVFDGPMSGYPMELHGKEAVVPLTSEHTIPVKLPLPKVEPKMDNTVRKVVKQVAIQLDITELLKLIKQVGEEIDKSTAIQTHILRQVRN